jgi:hypothetical protein
LRGFLPPARRKPPKPVHRVSTDNLSVSSGCCLSRRSSAGIARGPLPAAHVWHARIGTPKLDAATRTGGTALTLLDDPPPFIGFLECIDFRWRTTRISVPAFLDNAPTDPLFSDLAGGGPQTLSAIWCGSVFVDALGCIEQCARFQGQGHRRGEGRAHGVVLPSRRRISRESDDLTRAFRAANVAS